MIDFDGPSSGCKSTVLFALRRPISKSNKPYSKKIYDGSKRTFVGLKLLKAELLNTEKTSYLIWPIVIYTLFIGFAFYVVIKYLHFQKEGIEKKAKVIRLVDKIERWYDTGSGGTILDVIRIYDIEVDGKIIRIERRDGSLPVGKTITVIVSPKDDKDLIVGTKSQGLFAFYSELIGGSYFALLSLAVYVILIYYAPSILKDLRNYLERFR